MPSLRDLYQSDADYARSLLNARRNAIPSALRAPEQGLQGGMELGSVGGIPVSLTDLIPADFGANALATLGKAGLAKMAGGAALVGGMKSVGGKSLAEMIGNKTEFELAHEVAQRNAALPIEQGGLGLPPNNTAMDRAKAMGFDTPAYHGTEADVHKFKKNKVTAYGDRFFFSPESEYAGLYSDMESKIAGNVERVKKWKTKNASNSGANIIPTLLKSGEFKDFTHISPEYVVKDPKTIRSRFAAFDPMQRNSANILAGGAGGAIGLSSLLNYQDEYQ